MAVDQCGDACGIIAAIFQPLQRLEYDGSDILRPSNADDATHAISPFAAFSAFLRVRNFSAQPRNCFCSRAFNGESILADIFVIDRPAPVIAPSPTLHRRHQRGIRTDERARADIGEMLVETIVIAGDGARADIGARADARIAQIGQMVGLGAFFDPGLLHFDEIADMDVLLDHRAGTQTRIRPDQRTAADFRAFEMRERLDLARRLSP